MGNQMTRTGSHKKTDSAASGTNARATNNLSKQLSTVDGAQNAHTQFFPIDHLAKILFHLSQQEEQANGITKSVFRRYLFPTYPEFGERLFMFLHHNSASSTKYLPIALFKQQAEKFLAVMNDQVILENYVRMYSNIEEDGEIVPENLRALMIVSYQLAMSSKDTAICLRLDYIMNSIIMSCFHGKDKLSVNYVSNWIWQNCPRIVHGLHRYSVHVLTTAYRNGNILLSKEQPEPHPEIPTPILENSNPFNSTPSLLPTSYVWILSTCIPLRYLQLDDVPPPKDIAHALIAQTSGHVCPSHWTLLYSSTDHGTGVNRFLHHVLGYRGPTILFVRAIPDKSKDDDQPTELRTYCICNAVEWRESHLYWGDEDSVAIELFPCYKVLEKGVKTLYLNTSIRGYPLGLRFGSDPRNPCIIIDDSFNSVTISGAPYRIDSLEVWGCGNRIQREKQLEIKKWQVKEAEKQRIVKLSATDWLDHPDRYLLELAGRASYNESSN